ncbi:hypothetical protein [Variovorax sp. J22R115]|uniref:hypothetical protein n=1 Tax=Variovorax sp. J22R115 TaxID=3053509 RepID=UPI002578A9BE|nr:hypothetical protein [Variovorax sp. J22R115]MDM0053990.1 hypothetical protein [Variovorax sp. J22R115]
MSKTTSRSAAQAPLRARRARPAVAGVNQQAGQENLQAKVDAIHAVLALKSPSIDALSRLPPSPRQFHLWIQSQFSLSSSLPAVSLRMNSPDTLKNAGVELQAAVQNALDAVARANGGRRLAGGKDRISNLRARLARSEKLRKILEGEFSDWKANAESLHGELRKIKAAAASEANKANEELARRELLLQEERARVAELTKALRKFTPLRRRV